MKSDAPQITLVGRISSWRLHLPATAIGTTKQATIAGVRDAPLVVTWLRHTSYGLMGIYTRSSLVLGDIEWQRGAWIRVRGCICPCRVAALPDDPRSALAPTDAPLLVSINSIEHVVTPPTVAEKPFLSSPQSVRVSSGKRAGSGWIGNVVGWPDTVIWQTMQTSLGVFSTWNTAFGVVTRYGRHRYLRYVLRSISPTDQPRERYE